MATDDSKAITLRELAIRTIEQLTARIDVLKDFSEDIHKEQQMESEKKQQRFGALRAELTRCGYTQQELGIGIRRSLTYMNLRFNGKSQWELEDMYKIMAFLRLPVCELNKYFPRNGIEREASGRRGAQVFSAGNEALRAFRGEMAKETGHGKAL